MSEFAKALEQVAAALEGNSVKFGEVMSIIRDYAFALYLPPVLLEPPVLHLVRLMI